MRSRISVLMLLLSSLAQAQQEVINKKNQVRKAEQVAREYSEAMRKHVFEMTETLEKISPEPFAQKLFATSVENEREINFSILVAFENEMRKHGFFQRLSFTSWNLREYNDIAGYSWKFKDFVPGFQENFAPTQNELREFKTKIAEALDRLEGHLPPGSLKREQVGQVRASLPPLGFWNWSSRETRYADFLKLRKAIQFIYQMARSSDIDPQDILLPRSIAYPVGDSTLARRVISEVHKNGGTLSFLSLLDLELQNQSAARLLLDFTDAGFEGPQLDVSQLLLNVNLIYRIEYESGEKGPAETFRFPILTKKKTFQEALLEPGWYRYLEIALTKAQIQAAHKNGVENCAAPLAPALLKSDILAASTAQTLKLAMPTPAKN